ncbi:hypothetical protein NEOLEDRAFT_1149007 [Neolentinus lepideus HHB14362 ss-1]|uniref:Uncharacterized protein n=1 Tax=Neolentinus lepideus HHB14362 ss-1 TaxID=1314782 RepID=A0A165RK83_9AGAM|nr:hypothetical protein NEOLEDRAFT_1149007 [Neolentinus lepideus HHB14362 ss-1]
MVNWKDPLVIAYEAGTWLSFRFLSASSTSKLVYTCMVSSRSIYTKVANNTCRWEFIVTFPFEWSIYTGSRQFRWSIAIYILCRWLALFAFALFLAIFNIWTEINCTGLAHFAIGLTSVLLAMRTIAINGGAKMVKIPIVLLLLANWGTLLHVSVVGLLRKEGVSRLWRLLYRQVIYCQPCMSRPQLSLCLYIAILRACRGLTGGAAYRTICATRMYKGLSEFILNPKNRFNVNIKDGSAGSSALRRPRRTNGSTSLPVTIRMETVMEYDGAASDPPPPLKTGTGISEAESLDSTWLNKDSDTSQV